MGSVKKQHRAIVRQSLYEAVDVWKRISSDQVLRYRCFRILPERRFCVQSADHYYLPLDENLRKQHKSRFLELLAEEAPDVREKTYETLEEAIEMFEQGFEEEFGNIEEYLKSQREQ
jgi:hypothetical protein